MAKSVKSIRLDKELHKQVKIYCIKHGIKMSELIERGIKEAMKNGQMGKSALDLASQNS